MKYLDKPLDPLATLLPEQEKRLIAARSHLLGQHPFFAFLLFSKMRVIFTGTVPTLATDGTRLYVNPEYLAKLHLLEAAFALCHEIMHGYCLHCDRGAGYGRIGSVNGLPFVHMLWNFAIDYRTNSTLITNQVGRFRQGDWLHDAKYDDEKWLPELIYQDLFQQCQQEVLEGLMAEGDVTGNDQGPAGSKGPPCPGPLDQHLAPPNKREDGLPEPQRADAREWRQAMAEAMAYAQAMGKMPAGLQRVIEGLLEAQVPWQDHLRMLVTRKVGTGTHSWRKLNRRRRALGMLYPGKSGFGCDHIVVGVDTSGSITAADLKVYLAELSSIVEDCQPRETVVLWCDAAIGRIDRLGANDGSMEHLRIDLAKTGTKGGGGTDFRPVFEWVEEQGMRPDTLIYLTDTAGTFPAHAPGYPVIWCITTDNEALPFGEVVKVSTAKVRRP